ncbi:S8 family serine peptidase [Virgibacillus sp. DJP39]|uniref:S8 family peptidase n=1 Tax=Virgibacillus sp. DJP39 TaxID=3409790 RepID=UPI003BB7FC6F
MKGKIVICISCVWVVLLGLTINLSAEEVEEQRIIVGFEKEVELQELTGIPYELHHKMNSINAASITVQTEAIKSIEELPSVKWVERDYIVTTDAQVVDWGYSETIVSGTMELGLTGAGVKIGIIDTGINSNHPDLQVAGGQSFVAEESGFQDLNGHGTHVAGIIGAQNNLIGMVGVAPNAQIYAIKSLDQSGQGRQTDIIAGIEWAIKQQLDIVNLSITTSNSSIALQKAIEAADQAGLLIVAASGNDETGTGQIGTDIMYPARYPEVIGVGSINKELTKSVFSYAGSSLSFAAPGEAVYSTYENNYTRLSGTSMATPYVSGVIALYKEAYPYMNTDQIKSVLAKQATDLGVPGRDTQYGYGLVQSPDNYYRDLQTDTWYTSYVHYLIRHNLINGFPDGTFRPGKTITREEATTLIGRVLDLNGTKRKSGFIDVNLDSFGSGYIVSATTEGIITGYPDNTFKPNESITRGEVAVVIQRAFDLPMSETKAFSDVSSNSFFFKEINALYEAEIIEGYPNYEFLPNKEISRAEFSIILAKVLNKDYR